MTSGAGPRRYMSRDSPAKAVAVAAHSVTTGATLGRLWSPLPCSAHKVRQDPVVVTWYTTLSTCLVSKTCAVS